MNGVEHKPVRGSAKPEHALLGRSMSTILRPSNDTMPMTKSSQAIGIGAKKPQAGVVGKAEEVAPRMKRTASDARCTKTEARLWLEENEIDVHATKPLGRTMVSKSKSRERYFQSACTTLPGPTIGLNSVRTRELE